MNEIIIEIVVKSEQKEKLFVSAMHIIKINYTKYVCCHYMYLSDHCLVWRGQCFAFVALVAIDRSLVPINRLRGSGTIDLSLT